MGEKIKSGTNDSPGWQRVARQTYRRSTEKEKLTKEEKRALQLERMLDDTAEEGKRIRRGHNSASEGIQPGDPARIEMRDDESGRNPEERAARRIIDAPSKDHLSE